MINQSESEALAKIARLALANSTQAGTRDSPKLFKSVSAEGIESTKRNFKNIQGDR
jgi:hypothetical protein